MKTQIIKDYILSMVDRDQLQRKEQLQNELDSTLNMYREEIINCDHELKIADTQDCKMCLIHKMLIERCEKDYKKKLNLLLQFKASIMQFLDHETDSETLYNPEIYNFWKTIDEKHKADGIILVNEYQ